MTYVSTKLRCYSGIIRLYYEDEQFIKAWSFEDIKNTVYRWFSIEKREINVNVSNLETSFYHRENIPYGRTESDNTIEEPIVRIYGEIIKPDITDDNIKEELISLFSFLSSELKQKCQFYFQGYRENAYIRLC
jgi:hypothetical protein